METGIIVLAHGSKIISGTEDLHKIVDMVREIGRYDVVEAAFLQLASPSLSESIKKFTQRRIKKIVIMPLLLFSGNHVLKDIPRTIEAERAVYPDVTFVMTKNIGPDMRIAQIAHERIQEVLNG